MPFGNLQECSGCLLRALHFGLVWFSFLCTFRSETPPLNIVYVTCVALEDIFHLQPLKDLFHFNVLGLTGDQHLPNSRLSVAFVISADSS